MNIEVFEALDFIYDSIEIGEGVSCWTTRSNVPLDMFPWFKWCGYGMTRSNVPLNMFPWFDRDELITCVNYKSGDHQRAIRFCEGDMWCDIEWMYSRQSTLFRAVIYMMGKDIRFLRFARNSSTCAFVISHHKERVIEMRKMGRWVFTTNPTITPSSENFDRLLNIVHKSKVEWCEHEGYICDRLRRTPLCLLSGSTSELSFDESKCLEHEKILRRMDPILFHLVAELGVSIVPLLKLHRAKSLWEVFLLGTHERLGKSSAINMLCEDVLFLILGHLKSK